LKQEKERKKEVSSVLFLSAVIPSFNEKNIGESLSTLLWRGMTTDKKSKKKRDHLFRDSC